MTTALTTGADDGKGYKVATILGESTIAVVYTTADNQLRWKYHQNGGAIPAPMVPARQKFDALMTDISTSVPSKHKPPAYAHLGKALFNALDVNEPAKIDEAFTYVVSFVNQVRMQRARLVYVRAFLIVALVIISVALAVSYLPVLDVVMKGVIGVIFGVAGACISVLQRSASTDVDIAAGESLVAVQGGARALVGALFGLFVVLASVGDLVLGVAKANVVALAALAVVGGVSERLVPEIIGKLEGMS